MKYGLFIIAIIITFGKLLFGFEYSFINNKETLDFTAELLRSVDIPEDGIELWITFVEDYNSKIEFINQTTDGWLNSTDLSEFSKNFINGGDYYVNCRIALFTLIRDMISVDTCLRSDSLHSVEDQEITRMQEFIDPELSESEQESYRSLFASVRIAQGNVTEESLSSALEMYRAWWDKEGLIFPENEHLSIIQVGMVTSAGYAWEDHVALLIEHTNGLYLIEKRSPRDPFMISLHPDTYSVGKYLSILFDDYMEDDDTGILILRNDQMMWSKLFD